jgi:hypothetical protein
MTGRCIAFLFTAFAAALFAEPATVSKSGETVLNQNIETISICHLLSDAKSYEGKTVRLMARYSRLISLESVFTGPNCKSQGGVAVGYEEQRANEIGDRFEAMLNSWRTNDADVTVVGSLRGPVTSDSHYNYGHLRRYKYQFVISRVEKVVRVRSNK